MSLALAIWLILSRAVVGSSSSGGSPDMITVMSQRHALADLYSATRMDQLPLNWFKGEVNTTIVDANTSMWTSNHDYCSFYGVTCDDEGYVIALDLNQSGLVGTIPDVRFLSRLVRLQLNRNFLEGTIPESLWQLSSLQHLYLGENYLVGTIPPVPESSQLRRFMVASNLLTGTIPQSVCNWRRLISLDLSNNAGIRGTLPPCFETLSNLTRLQIDDLLLTGTIPSGLCALREMNGMVPNLFGCDAIGCGAGYYQRLQGRQISSETPCTKCLVPSNLIASTRCFWFSDDDDALPAEVAPASSGTPSCRPSSSPSNGLAPSPSPFTSSNAVVPGIMEVDTGHHRVTIVGAFLGVAIAAICCLLYVQIRRRIKTERSSMDAVESGAAPAEHSSHPPRRTLSCSLPKLCRLKAEKQHSIEGQELDHVIPRALPCFGPRGSILRTSSRYKAAFGTQDRIQGPQVRRVKFSLPDDGLSKSLDLCSLILKELDVGEDEKSTAQTAISRDPDTWASWVLNPDIRAASPTSADEGIASNDAIASAPLLSSLHQPSDNWRCCSDDSIRENQNMDDMLWPSNLTTESKVPDENERGCSVQGLVGAFGCGWLNEVNLDDLVDEEYNDMKQGHVEV